MDSLSEIVDIVIGVDTHVATHSAASVSPPFFFPWTTWTGMWAPVLA